MAKWLISNGQSYSPYGYESNVGSASDLPTPDKSITQNLSDMYSNNHFYRSWGQTISVPRQNYIVSFNGGNSNGMWVFNLYNNSNAGQLYQIQASNVTMTFTLTAQDVTFKASTGGGLCIIPLY